jgi:hypothetical protein
MILPLLFKERDRLKIPPQAGVRLLAKEQECLFYQKNKKAPVWGLFSFSYFVIGHGFSHALRR